MPINVAEPPPAAVISDSVTHHCVRMLSKRPFLPAESNAPSEADELVRLTAARLIGAESSQAGPWIAQAIKLRPGGEADVSFLRPAETSPPREAVITEPYRLPTRGLSAGGRRRGPRGVSPGRIAQPRSTLSPPRKASRR